MNGEPETQAAPIQITRAMLQTWGIGDLIMRGLVSPPAAPAPGVVAVSSLYTLATHDVVKKHGLS